MLPITNIDVTLRDGGYRNGFSFPKHYALAHADLAIAAGFDWVEIAYLKGSFKPETSTGLTGRGSCDYISTVASRIGPEHVALIAHPHNISAAALTEAYHAGARLIRLCINAADPSTTWALLEHAKNLGFTCAANLTRVSNLDDGVIAERATEASRHGADAIYLADSNGALHPADVARLTTIAGAAGDLAVGLHAHNNIGLALANAISAVDAGARWIDSSILGMGKGAGNLVAEQWLVYLDRQRHDQSHRFDLAALLELSRILSASVPESAPVIPAADLILGRYNLSVEHRHRLHRTDSRISLRAARKLALPA